MDEAYDIVSDQVLFSTTEAILFANPKSGSNKAAEYLKLEDRKYKISSASETVYFNIYDLTSNDDRVSAVIKIKELLSIAHAGPLRVIVAGGDGSLIWTIENLIKENICLDNILFGILPFGSGNDLSANLGWGRDPPSDLWDPFMHKWMVAVPHHLDIWSIKVRVHHNGGIGKVHKTRNSVEKVIMEENKSNKLVLKRLMSNYFSIGLDARIGLGFDKHRTTSKCCNKFMYCWEGLKKMCCCVKTARIPELVNKLECADSVIVDNSNSETALHKDTSVLLALNIRTYAGGENYVWDKARVAKQRKWEKQSPSDGKLEVLTFEGKMSLGLEQIKCTQGQGKKLEQSPGPYYIKFNDTDRKCYFQIDGEYYYLERPKKISIELWDKCKDIRVLFKSSS